MQRSKRPVPIAIPQKEAPTDYKLTNSGVFSQGEISISKAGCVINRPSGPGSLPSSSDGEATSAQKRAQGSSNGGIPASTNSPQEQSPSQAEIALDDLQELTIIGSGSSGVVKKVRHKSTGDVFVLKIINFDVNSEQLRKQVMMELKTLYGAQHPHIVQYHQSYFANGAITILMEYMDGGSLYDLLQKVRRLSERAVAEVARQVLQGLVHLHKQLRVVHRDIKPSNLLLNSSGHIKISDFGVSSQLSNSMSKCLSWVGTVTYMSPERIRGDTYSFNTDIWSLGLLLLESATGRFPYPPPGEGMASSTGLGFWELLEYIVVEPAPRLPKGQFSLEFSDFISQCLQKDAKSRPSASQLLQHPFFKKYPQTPLSEVLPVGGDAAPAIGGQQAQQQQGGQQQGWQQQAQLQLPPLWHQQQQQMEWFQQQQSQQQQQLRGGPLHMAKVAAAGGGGGRGSSRSGSVAVRAGAAVAGAKPAVGGLQSSSSRSGSSRAIVG